MRDAPSAELIELLARLGLATPEQVRSVRRVAHSLAKDSPLFDSVWVDALMRRRLLTPFQAAEINAGRGAALAIGPLVLYHPPERLGYANHYLAQLRDSGEQVRVAVATLNAGSTPAVLTQLKGSAEQLDRARQAETALGVLPLTAMGSDGNLLWVMQPQQADITLRECLLRGGRLPAELVLEIARQMTVELAALERFSLVHGDISADTVRIHDSGQVQLAHLGLRTVVRPGEGYAHADLPPEAYDYLAPERVSVGTVATVQSDLYACGCLWWQLLTGRAPLVGGDSLAKIKAAHAARIVPVSRMAPEAPAVLISIISRLTQSDPSARGASFADLAAMLGPAAVPVRQRLAEYVVKLRPWTSKQPAHFAQKNQPFVRQQRPQTTLLWQDFSPAVILGQWKNYLSTRSRSLTALTVAFGVLALATATGFIWRSAMQPQPPALASLAGRPGPTATVPPILLTPELLATGRPLDTRKDSAQGLPASSDVQRASHTSDSRSLVTAAGNESSALAESSAGGDDPPRSVSKQFLPVREIVLPVDRIIQATALELHPGLRLAPPPGLRAKIQVPLGGWRIDVEELRVENVDFIASSSTAEGTAANTALLQLVAAKAQFHGCSFQSSRDKETVNARTTAIQWTGTGRTDSLDRLPTAGHLLLANCFLANFHTGIDCQLNGPVVLELDNVLVTGPEKAAQAGPLWKLDRSPASEDTIVLRMNACTIRSTMSLVDIYCAELPVEPGKLKLDTTDCIFAPRSSGALLRLIGPFRPDRLLHSIIWSGRGSLLPIQGRFGLWYDAQGSPHAIDDTGIEIDGLVRGGVEFAGTRGADPQDSTLIHWAAPLIGDSRPGVRVSALPGGKSR